jgi:hypothetical protein
LKGSVAEKLAMHYGTKAVYPMMRNNEHTDTPIQTPAEIHDDAELKRRYNQQNTQRRRLMVQRCQFLEHAPVKQDILLEEIQFRRKEASSKSDDKV